MRCTYCGVEQTRAIDTGPIKDRNIVKRRRECLNCGKRFTTYEEVALKDK